MAITKTGRVSLDDMKVHDHPSCKFSGGSYFDTATGEYYMNLDSDDNSGFFDYPEGLRLYAVFDGNDPGDDANLAYEFFNVTDYPFNQGGATSFSGTVSISGHSTMRMYFRCQAKDLGVDCGIGNQYLDQANTDEIVFQLIRKPVISSLENANKYDGASGISASETSIKVKYNIDTDSGDTETHAKYKVGVAGSEHTVENPTNNTLTISNLSAGTTYTIYVALYNDAGWTDWSSITIRTRYEKPTISVSHDHATQSGLEDVTISWSSDKNIQQIQYTIDGSSWITYESGQNKRSGTVKITTKDGADLYDNTTYKITVRVKSTNAYDYLWSNASSQLSPRTDRRAVFNSGTNLITGGTLHIDKTNESGNRNQIRLFITGFTSADTSTDEPTGSKVAWFNQDPATGSNNYYITPTVAQWDAAYKRFLNPSVAAVKQANHNRIRLTRQVVTYGRSREYVTEDKLYIVLNGDIRTTHTNVNGSIKRGKVWCRPDGSIKRGVAWITSSKGVWRRGC